MTYGMTYETYIYIEREIPQQTRLCGARSGSPQLLTLFAPGAVDKAVAWSCSCV